MKSRKPAFAVLFLLLFSSVARLWSQEPLVPRDTANFPYWIDMMHDRNVPFRATQSAFYHYWANRETNVKGNGYKVFKRWEYINEPRVLPNGLRQPADYVLKVYQDYAQKTASDRSTSGSWTLVGPAVYPANNTAQPTGMGRVNAIAFDPVDPNIIYVGAPAGGIWKTSNGGASWVSLSSNLPTLGISCIVVDPSAASTIYLGTGDRDSDDAPGLGVYKSTNGGLTWVAANTNMDNGTIVNTMIMSPSNSNLLLAGTSTGLYKSTNGGASWSKKLTGTVWKDMKFKPGDPTVVYAVYGSSFYRSSNTGDNWSLISPLPITGSLRMVIGVTPADPTYVYLLSANSSSSFGGIMLSTNSGLSFSTMSTTPNILGYACDGSDASGQGGYDLCINVAPGDKNTLYLGGINLWKSTNGGVNHSIISHWVGSSFGTSCAASVHADQHCLEWSPLNGKLYAGNDGGIYWTGDGGLTWTEISSGLEIAQVYKIGQSATNYSLTMNGYQDNGSAIRALNAFTTNRGGDGMECVIDYTNSNYRYNTTPNGKISRSLGGAYFAITESTNGITETGAWVTPYHLHPSNTDVMFAGYKNVWRTNNVKSIPSTSVSWSTISSGETTNCVVLEQSKADQDVLYVVRSGQLKRSDNANAAAASVSWTSCALPGSSYTPTDLVAHPTNANIVYATANYGVYKSTDKGASWTDISGSLPALFTNCLVFDNNSNEGLYVGNQTGVWYKDNNLSDWVAFSSGLPTVDIRELEIFADPIPANSILYAATYGRGLWESDLYVTALPVELTYFKATCDESAPVLLQWTTASEQENNYFTVERSADGLLWQEVARIDGAGNSNVLRTYSCQDFFPGNEPVVYYRLVQTDYNGQSKKSDIISAHCLNAEVESIRFSPNPSDGYLRIDGYKGPADLKIYNQLGQVVYQAALADGGHSDLSISDLLNGIYFAKLSSRSKIETSRLVFSRK